jgi:hypothetical protein
LQLSLVRMFLCSDKHSVLEANKKPSLENDGL